MEYSSVYIFRRFPILVSSVLKHRSSQKFNFTKIGNYDKFPFFVSYINGLFEDFINKNARLVDKRFEDLIYQPTTIYLFIKEYVFFDWLIKKK